ncbi:hypothetical protein PMAYCL1PPCAC_13535, partial [Pristionchus mayeri]
ISLFLLAFKIIWSSPFIHRPMEETSRKRAKPALPVVITILEQDLSHHKERDLAIRLLYGLLFKVEREELRNIRLFRVCIRHLSIHINEKPITNETALCRLLNSTSSILSYQEDRFPPPQV